MRKAKRNNMERTQFLTRRELRNELFGILAMINGFDEVGHTGGVRQEEMIEYLPHQIAKRIMELQDLIERCVLEGKYQGEFSEVKLTNKE